MKDIKAMSKQSYDAIPATSVYSQISLLTFYFFFIAWVTTQDNNNKFLEAMSCAQIN